MAQLRKKDLEKIREFRNTNPSKQLDNLLLEFVLDNSLSNKQNLTEFLSSQNKDFEELFQREELYRLINREKAKVRYREKSLDIMRRNIANNGGFSRLDFDRNMEYFDWLKMNVRNNFSKMSIEDLKELLNKMIEFNLMTNTYDKRADLVVKGKIVQFLISAKRGASDEGLAAMRETTIQYIMVVKKCDYDQAEEIFDDMVNEIEDDATFGRNNFYSKIVNEKTGEEHGYGVEYW